MEQATIQYQTKIGNWITVQHVLNNDLNIRGAMVQVKRMYPESRVRAVDDNGRTIDIYD